MKGLLFEYKLWRLAIGKIVGVFSAKGYMNRFSHLRLVTLPNPHLLADDWLIIRAKYCGICGSDTKQTYLDGNIDNPMTALISWPQVLGHEVVGIVDHIGPAVKTVKVGDRVVLNPWLSCPVRELQPCKACQAGKNTLCRNFKKGLLAPGIHTGNSKDATGGFAELVPAHESMAVPIPDGVTWDQAVLADPFSVAFHSIMKVRPQPGSICAVYGLGTLGLLSILILKHVLKDVKVIAIARFPHQASLAKTFGADLIINAFPAQGVIEAVAGYLKCEIYTHKNKHPWLIEGVDFLFDTVASPQTLEVGLRITRARGIIVVTGVASPKRYEWTPLYFKEIHIIGSNAFSVEDFEGHREHAYQHYFRFLKAGRVDPTPILTHKYPFMQYKDALAATHEQRKSAAVKVLLVHENFPQERTTQ